MVRKSLLALVGALTLSLGLVAGAPAFAQDQDPAAAAAGRAGQDQPQSDLQTGRSADRNDREQRRRRAPVEPTPEQNMAAAQALLTTAGVGCQVTEAARLGVTTADQKTTFEVICASGPGYLVIDSTPPQTFSCLNLVSSAIVTRERDANADVGQQCTLPVNQQTVPFIAAYAQEAGVPCTVDEGFIAGKSDAENLIYEVGCADASGYWIEKQATGWVSIPCYDLVLTDPARCRYTTPAEIAGFWKTALASTPAAPCDYDRARRVGRDGQGLTVYELKCAAGDGYFARMNAQHAVTRVQTCAEAVNVAGGCTLTTAAPAAPATQQQ